MDYGAPLSVPGSCGCQIPWTLASQTHESSWAKSGGWWLRSRGPLQVVTRVSNTWFSCSPVHVTWPGGLSLGAIFCPLWTGDDGFEGEVHICSRRSRSTACGPGGGERLGGGLRKVRSHSSPASTSLCSHVLGTLSSLLLTCSFNDSSLVVF